MKLGLPKHGKSGPVCQDFEVHGLFELKFGVEYMSALVVVKAVLLLTSTGASKTW